jgi:hypothetical protein
LGGQSKHENVTFPNVLMKKSFCHHKSNKHFYTKK